MGRLEYTGHGITEGDYVELGLPVLSSFLSHKLPSDSITSTSEDLTLHGFWYSILCVIF